MIRSATINEANRLAEIYVFGWRHAFHEFVPKEYLYKKLSVENRKRVYEKLLEKENSGLFVYEEDEIIKGLIHMGKCENPDKHSAYAIWDIFIEPLMTGKGLGRKLIEYCENIAISSGFEENVIWVFEKNINAIRLYMNMGYILDDKEEYNEMLKTTSIRLAKRLTTKTNLI